MNSLELKQDLLRKLYIEDSSALTGVILDGLEADVVTAINESFQSLWTAPFDHFRRKHFTFPTVIGTSAYTLDQTVQDVLGPVKANDATPHLRPIKDRGDFDNYATRFKKALTNSSSNARPEAYFLERLFRDAADSALIKMLLTPAPDAVYTIDMEASTEAPSFTLAEIDSAVALPIPHQYVETVLLPIARMNVTRSHYFLADERPTELQKMEQDFIAARKQIGDTDPQLPHLKEPLPQP